MCTTTFLQQVPMTSFNKAALPMAIANLVMQVRSIAAELNPAIQVALPTYAIIGGAAMLSGFVRYRYVQV